MSPSQVLGLEKNVRVASVLFFAGFLLFLTPAARASTTNGTINTSQKYAWGDKLGWVNFGTTGGNVHVADSGLTGYAWSQNYGWINLAPTKSGVTNNGNGTLSGSAWGENLGYINFSGVTINSSGRFTGSASGTVAGTITFDCTNCAVSTDWRPQSARGATATTTPSSGGGGGNAGGPPAASYYPPTPPPGGFRVIVNGGAPYTTSSQVTLEFVVGTDVASVAVSNGFDFSFASQVPYHSPMFWDLCAASLSCPEGLHQVFAKFYTSYGRSSEAVSSSIVFVTVFPSGQVPPVFPSGLAPAPPSPLPPPPAASLGGTLGALIGKVPEFLRSLLPPPTLQPPRFLTAIPEFLRSFLPPFLQGKPAAVQSPPVTVPRLAQRSLKGIWELLPQKPIHAFALTPLPAEFTDLAVKFPGLGKTFAGVGVTKQANLPKLQNATFALPGLSEAVGLLPAAPHPGLFAPPPGMPLASLSSDVKKKLPSEVLFVRSLGEKLDFPLNLKLNPAGLPQSQMETVAGTPLHLVVKPEYPARRVHGYLVFDSRLRSNAEVGYQVPVTSLLGSLFFAAPKFSAPVSQSRYLSVEGANVVNVAPSDVRQLLAQHPNVEKRLALLEFDYEGPGDAGIYTADIRAPVVEGKYEVITRIDYQDISLPSKEIRLITVVDPEGYVFEAQGGKETRIPGAVVTMRWLNPATKQYEPWPAASFNQENPQVTGVAGTYAFLVPAGYYELTVDAPGYEPYQGRPFEVQAGTTGVHFNIELKNKYWYLSLVDWKTALLVVVALLLLYNFYKDQRRGRMTPPAPLPPLPPTA